jgi:hypothetical protein
VQAYHIVDFNKTKAKHEPVGTLGSINSIVSKCHLAIADRDGHLHAFWLIYIERIAIAGCLAAP